MANNAGAINVHIDKKYIWPSGELGVVVISKDDVDNEINLTIEQARSLMTVLQSKLKE